MYLYIYLWHGKHAHSCPTLSEPKDCSPPGFSAHEIFQARIPEWVAIPFSKGASQPRDQTYVSHIFCIGRQILYHHVTWEDHVYTYRCIYKYITKQLKIIVQAVAALQFLFLKRKFQSSINTKEYSFMDT